MAVGIFAGLLPLALIGLLCYSAVRTVCMGLTLPKPLRGNDTAGVCGVCHYPVTRGHGHICPECGRAYADAGVLSPALARSMRPSMGSVIAGWIMMLLVVYGLAMALVSVVSPADDELTITIAFALAGVFVLALIGLGFWSAARRNRIFAPPPEPD